MADLTVDDIVRGIKQRVAKNDPEHNSTWNYATRVEIAEELDVRAEEVSDEVTENSPATGPLGDAVDQGRVERHPTYLYFKVVE